MRRIEVRYGRVRLVGVDAAEAIGLSWRPARVVDDVLGVLRTSEDREAYRGPYLLTQYSLLYQTATEEQWSDLAERFTRAVREGEDGRLAVDVLAPFLGGIRRLRDGVVEVENFPAFVAFCLQEVLRGGPLVVQECELCGLPWLAERGARYCLRPAPGHVDSCRKVATHAKFRERRGHYHRQRRRLYDRMRRGTLPREEYEAWKRENSPDNWRRFEDWKRRTKGAKGG